MSDRTFPVIEIFGPTVQGEGQLAGLTTHFIRFGGCDYRCSWCDSLYAVLPEQVREHATKMTAHDIGEAIKELGGSPYWVTLSGGNPAMLDLKELVSDLHARRLKVSVETQGSRWRNWLLDVDCLTVSPKPPSSGMETLDHLDETRRFMSLAAGVPVERRSLKIVVFDEQDYDWAKSFLTYYPAWNAYLSVGTDQPDPLYAHLRTSHDEAVRRISDRYRWLCERVSNDPDLAHVRVLPQLHVIAWGHAKGV